MAFHHNRYSFSPNDEKSLIYEDIRAILLDLNKEELTQVHKMLRKYNSYDLIKTGKEKYV